MKIALVGDRSHGKTSFFAALHAQFQARQGSYIITARDDIARLRDAGITEQVSFVISGYERDEHKKQLDAMAEGITSRPIVWPPATDLPEDFLIRFMFERRNIGDFTPIPREKKIILLDCPGGAFDRALDGTADAEDTRARASRSEAVIAFIDASNKESIENSLDRVFNSISFILRKSAHSIKKGILPLTVALTKFDKYPPEERHEIHKILFNDIAQQFSSLSGKILLLSCPVSLANGTGVRFMPKNLSYPFLFSAMGIILSDHYFMSEKAANARSVRSRSLFGRFFQFLDDPQTIGSMNRSSVADLQLARAIAYSLEADVVLGRADLRFAQSGDELSPRQIRTVL